MGKKSKQPQGDILDEKYKGASAAVAAAGESYLAHWVLAFIGIAAGVAGGAIFSKPVKAIENTFNQFHINNRENSNILIRLSGKLAGATSGAAHWLAEHSGIERLLNGHATEHADRVESAIFGGGLLGAFGFFVAPLGFAVNGARNAFKGKDQFNRAKEEIRELREDRDFLEEKNAELRNELREIKTERLIISQDTPSATKDEPVKDKTHDEPEVLRKRKDDAEHEHARPNHTRHSDQHKQHAGKSHGEQVRERETRASEHAHGA